MITQGESFLEFSVFLVADCLPVLQQFTAFFLLLPCWIFAANVSTHQLHQSFVILNNFDVPTSQKNMVFT